MAPVKTRADRAQVELLLPLAAGVDAACFERGRNRLITASFGSGSRAWLSARYQHRSQQAGEAPGKARALLAGLV